MLGVDEVFVRALQKDTCMAVFYTFKELREDFWREFC